MTRIGSHSSQPPGDSETYAIIGAAMEVHRALGPGFLEPVYQQALAVELELCGVPFTKEVELPISYKGRPLSARYRVDFICYSTVLVELKALDRISGKEEAQVIHYLLSSQLKRGLLLNFGASSLQFRRFLGSNATPPLASVKSVSSVDALL